MALAYQSSTSLSSASSSAGAAGGLAASSGFGAGGAFDGSMTLGFFASGAMVCWPLAAALSRDFFLNVFGLNETSVK